MPFTLTVRAGHGEGIDIIAPIADSDDVAVPLGNSQIGQHVAIVGNGGNSDGTSFFHPAGTHMDDAVGGTVHGDNAALGGFVVIRLIARGAGGSVPSGRR